MMSKILLCIYLDDKTLQLYYELFNNYLHKDNLYLLKLDCTSLINMNLMVFFNPFSDHDNKDIFLT